jgi:DNA-binding NtrC family response regulator
MVSDAAVLVVDDDAAVGKVLSALLRQDGFDVTHVPSGEAALARLEARPFDVVLSDLRMEGMDGLALLREVERRWPELPFVLMTAHGSVPVAVEAMRAGAVDFVLKPLDKDELLYVVKKAIASAKDLSAQVPAAASAGPALVGDSPGMREVMAVVRKAAPGTATVLVRGETGTGKELVARAVHDMSPRKHGPFVKVHCAALPDALLESELFGYEKGAFTGAMARKPGRVELADKGTLFLDEIGDVTPAVQVKLLRVLQERELERLGGTQTVKVDVRFVAATHRDLEARVASGEFREDLFYRLSVVPVRIPPLRDRPGDVERLATHFVREMGRANAKPRITLDAEAMAALRSYAWPGNVRQLQNLAERLVVLADGDVIGRADVEREIGAPGRARPQLVDEAAPASGDTTLDARRRDAEKDAIVGALSQAKNNRTLAARLLNVSRRTLYNKLREHGLE